MSSTVFQRLRTHWNRRRKYQHTSTWVLESYQRLIPKFTWLPLPGRSSTVLVRLKGHERPFFARMGTSDWLVIEEIFDEDEYGPLLKRDLGPIRHVVDLGANVGISVRLWQATFPDAHVLAVEPDEENVAVLRKNAADCVSGRVTVVQACIAGRSRAVRLGQGAASWAIKMEDDAEGDGPTVQARTLPELLTEAGFPEEIDLLKCDIEGAEQELFRDASAWLKRVRNLVVEVHPPYQPSDLIRDVERVGLRFEAVAPDDASHAQIVMFFRRNPLT